MSEATKELIWMNQKEEIETFRDWSEQDLNVEEIEKYRKVEICLKGKEAGRWKVDICFVSLRILKQGLKCMKLNRDL